MTVQSCSRLYILPGLVWDVLLEHVIPWNISSRARKNFRNKFPICLYIKKNLIFKNNLGVNDYVFTWQAVSPIPFCLFGNGVLSLWSEAVSPECRESRGSSHSPAGTVGHGSKDSTWERRRRANRSWRVWWKAVVSVIWRIDLKTTGRKENKSSLLGTINSFVNFKVSMQFIKKLQLTKYIQWAHPYPTKQATPSHP